MCGRVLAVSGRPTCVRTTGLGSLPRALLRVTRVRAPSLKSMRVSVIVHAAAVRAPPRYGAAGGSETHTQQLVAVLTVATMRVNVYA